MLTGDFDVLMNTISDTQVEVSDVDILTKGASSTMTVKDLLCSYLPEDVKTKSPGNNIIEDLQSQYPDLQISVPVHTEDWNAATYTPVVAFRPEDYQDSTVTVIPGYDAEGNFVWVDAINVPEEPVIVVGKSERIDTTRTVPIMPNNNVPPPAPPTGLTANLTSTGIILSWRQTGSPSMYYIYRKAEGETEFRKIGISRGTFNRTYEDKSISSSVLYSYYVVAVNVGNSTTNILVMSKYPSEPSEIITVKAPEVLESLSYFEAVTSGNQIELRWNNDGNTNTDVIIEYKASGKGINTYQKLIETTGQYNNYIYNSPYKGTQVDYRAYRRNEIGTSDAVYDYIYPPYRNAATYSPVYVKSISYTDDRVERWPAGKPEFFLKIVGTDGNGNTVELQDEIEFRFSDFDAKRDKVEYFSNRLVYNWMPLKDSQWYSALTFYLEECDESDLIKFTAQAQLNTKLGNKLDSGLSAGITVDFSDNGENCGRTYTNFFDNPEIDLSFPNYGAKVRLSEKP